MSTTDYATITRDELADLRWMAAEGIANAVHYAEGGRLGEDGLACISRVLARAWALWAIGQEVDHPTPGGIHDAWELPWPAALDAQHVATLLVVADEVEERYRLPSIDEEEYPAPAAHWWGRVEKVQRARVILESADCEEAA